MVNTPNVQGTPITHRSDPCTRIFIVEGLLTTIVGVASKWLLADWPEQAKFLADEERALLLAKLNRSEGVAKMDRLDKNALRRILQDWKIWTG